MDSVAMAHVQEDYAKDKNTETFDELQFVLTSERNRIPYRELAKDLGRSEASLKMAALRLRKRYRNAVRNEVAQTVADDDDVEMELTALLESLG